MQGEPTPFPRPELSYGYPLVRLPGRRRTHLVAAISLGRSILLDEPVWQATTTVCGRPGPWEGDDGSRQHCGACRDGVLHGTAWALAPRALR